MIVVHVTVLVRIVTCNVAIFYPCFDPAAKVITVLHFRKMVNRVRRLCIRIKMNEEFVQEIVTAQFVFFFILNTEFTRS